MDYSTLRCAGTGNLCGTDTWPQDVECHCEPCQRWLGHRDGFAAALAMLPSEGVMQAAVDAYVKAPANLRTAMCAALAAAADAMGDKG